MKGIEPPVPIQTFFVFIQPVVQFHFPVAMSVYFCLNIPSLLQNLLKEQSKLHNIQIAYPHENVFIEAATKNSVSLTVRCPLKFFI